MGSKWVHAKLGDYIHSNLGKMLDQNKNKGDFQPYLGNSNVRWGYFDLEDLSLMKFEEHESDRYGVRKGDLIICEGGEPGRCAIWEDDVPNMKIQKALHRVRPLPGLTSEYLYYWFLYFGRTGQLDAYFTGTTIKHLTGKALSELPIKIPTVDEQKYISIVLGSLDAKIKANRKINRTLEQMSQTLFKSWFVDFDPVIDNALDAGNPIPEALHSRAELRQKVRNSADFKPLPADIRILFPAEFEEMALGLIPKGWKFSNVNSLLKNTIGGDWGSDSEDEKHTTQAVIVRGTDIPELISGKLSSAPYRWVEPKKLEKRRINVGDIIIEVSGGSPTQSTGRSIFMTEQIIDRLGGVIEPASFCRKFEPLSVELGLIISLHLSKIYNDGKMWEYQNQSTGIANFQTKYFLEAEQIVIPSVQVINAFYRIVMPWIEKSHNNEQIILGNLRDTLLPKLISGELSLEDLPDLVTQTEPA